MTNKPVCEPIQIVVDSQSSDNPLTIDGFKLFHHGSEGGLRWLITGGVHGDETTSIAALWYLRELLELHEFQGQITLLPCVNELAVKSSSRNTPLENIDLNRSFPGRADGSLAERIAATLVTAMDNHDVLIDVHTAGWCVPFTIIDHLEDDMKKKRLILWLKKAGIPVIQEMPAFQADLQGLNRSWSAWVLSQGKWACTVELAGFHTLEHQCAKMGASTLFSLLDNWKFLAHSDLAEKAEDDPPIRIETYADDSGLFETDKKPGDSVYIGDRIGWIKSITGNIRKEIISNHNGFILALQPISAAHIGAWLVTIAAKA